MNIKRTYKKIGVIPFTEFIRPDGRQVQSDFHLWESQEEELRKAKKLIEEGYRFEAELLPTGQIFLECVNPDEDGEWGVLHNNLCRATDIEFSLAMIVCINDSYEELCERSE